MKNKIKFPKFKITVPAIPKFKIIVPVIRKIIKFKGVNSGLKSFYYTGLMSIVIIILFSATPKLLNLKNNLLIKSIEVKNESKSNLEKVLSGKKISKEQEDQLDNFQVFEDIF